MRIEQPRRTRRLISLTPLIDVVFILLVFFMLATSFLEWRSIDLHVSAAHSAAQSAQGALLVRVRAGGRLDLGGRPITVEHLAAQVRPFVERNPNQRVLVQPDDEVALQAVVTVLDQLRAAGATNMSLARD